MSYTGGGRETLARKDALEFRILPWDCTPRSCPKNRGSLLETLWRFCDGLQKAANATPVATVLEAGLRGMGVLAIYTQRVRGSNPLRPTILSWAT
jgi:hypothetical protein